MLSRPVVNIEILPVDTAFRLVSSQSPKDDMLVCVQYFNLAWKDPQGNKRNDIGDTDFHFVVCFSSTSSGPKQDFDTMTDQALSPFSAPAPQLQLC